MEQLPLPFEHCSVCNNHPVLIFDGKKFIIYRCECKFIYKNKPLVHKYDFLDGGEQ